MAIHVTDANFHDVVLKSNKLVMVDFWAEWCGPCRMVGPVVEQLGDEYPSVLTVTKLDVDNNPLTAREYKVMNIPTILFFKGGKQVDKIVGAVPKSKLEQLVQKHI
jgi:thioredoxin 1